MSSKQVDHEATFLTQYKQFNLPALDREVKFHPDRKFRFDYAIKSLMIAIEIEGGTYRPGGGRHTSMVGYQRDCVKYNEAQRLGWKVLRFTTADVLANRVCKYIWNFIYPDNPIF